MAEEPYSASSETRAAALRFRTLRWLPLLIVLPVGIYPFATSGARLALLLGVGIAAFVTLCVAYRGWEMRRPSPAPAGALFVGKGVIPWSTLSKDGPLGHLFSVSRSERLPSDLWGTVTLTPDRLEWVPNSVGALFGAEAFQLPWSHVRGAEVTSGSRSGGSLFLTLDDESQVVIEVGRSSDVRDALAKASVKQL